MMAQTKRIFDIIKIAAEPAYFYSLMMKSPSLQCKTKMLHVFVLFYSENKAPLYRYVLDNNAQKSDIYTDERKVK